LIPVSGRTVKQVRETARLLGAWDFIAELGGLTCYERESVVVRSPPSFVRGGTPFEALAASGVAGLLLDAYAGSIEPHAPWGWEDRSTSMLLRGHVDLVEVQGLLDRSGYHWVDIQDNGIVPGMYPGLATDEVHVYHLAPKGVNKASAVRADLARRSVRREEALAVGDSATDAALAPLVAAVFIVANGGPVLQGRAVGDNVYLTEEAYGDGFAEAALALVKG
jgi:hypothetical protein